MQDVQQLDAKLLVEALAAPTSRELLARRRGAAARFVVFYSSATRPRRRAALPELFRLPLAPRGDSPSATGRRVW